MDDSSINILATTMSTIGAVILGQIINYLLKLKRKRIDYLTKQIAVFGDKIEHLETNVRALKGTTPNPPYFFQRVNEIWNQTVVNAEYFKKVKGNRKFTLVKVRQWKHKDLVVEQFNSIENYLFASLTFKGKIPPAAAEEKIQNFFFQAKTMVNNFNLIRKGVSQVKSFEFSNLISDPVESESK